MDYRDLIALRYRVTRFKPEEVPDERVKGLVDEALSSLRTGNLRPWRFIIVKDAATKQALAEACYGQDVVADAPVVVACAGDEHECDRAATRVQGEIKSGKTWGKTETALKNLQRALDRDPDFRRSIATQTAYIAAEHLSLAAWDAGLGTCTIGWFDRAEVKRILDLPEYILLATIVLIGHPADEAPDRSHEPAPGPSDDLLYRDRFGRPMF